MVGFGMEQETYTMSLEYFTVLESKKGTKNIKPQQNKTKAMMGSVKGRRTQQPTERVPNGQSWSYLSNKTVLDYNPSLK